jgi:hypothetical protein
MGPIVVSDTGFEWEDLSFWTLEAIGLEERL